MERMAGGRKPRQAGDRCEREIVALHQETGVLAKRIVCSGSHLDKPYDLDIYHPDLLDPLRAEAKRRPVPKTIKKWLGENDLLFIRELAVPGRSAPKPLVVMTWETYACLIKR